MAPRFGTPITPLERHHCTMTMAAALGLPARLSAATDALQLADRKDVDGERLMHQMSKPRRARQGEDPDQLYWFDDDERRQRLHAYCRQDVAAERALFDRLVPLTEAEHALWQLNCKINERGFCVDRHLAEAARRIAQAAAPEIDAELNELTDSAVTGINQVARLLAWLQQQGCTLTKLERRAIDRQLDNERFIAGSAPGARTAARRCAGRSQEVRRAAAACRCRQPRARRVPPPWRVHRALVRRRIAAAELEAAGGGRSRSRHRRGCHRRLCTCPQPLSAAAGRGR